ncbi:STAS domain-containing protein [Endothiovibrio diazotrophicus]
MYRTAARLERDEQGRLRLRGPLDFSSVPRLLAIDDRLFDGEGPIHVDLSGVERADSSALALFTEWLREARRRGRQLRFDHLPPQLLAMARLSGVAEILRGDGA